MNSKQWHTCDRCGKNLSSYHSLWRHKKTCRSSSSSAAAAEPKPTTYPLIAAGEKRSMSPTIHIFNEADKTEKTAKNPKIHALLNEIVNEGTVKTQPEKEEEEEASTMFGKSIIRAENILPKSIPQAITEEYPSKEKVLPTLPPQEVEDVTPTLISFTPLKLVEAVHGDVPRLRAVDFVTKQSRTKGDIIGYSDDDDDEDSESSSDEAIDISDIHPNVKFLPTTVEGLAKRFNKLFCEFMRHKRYEHRNELVSILDDLRRQEGITLDEYTKLNDKLAESLGSGIEEKSKEDREMDVDTTEEEEPDMEKVIQTTVDSIIQHDKQELMTLLHEFKEEEKKYVDAVGELEEIIEIFLDGEFLERKSLISKIDELMTTLEASSIMKSKQLRFKMIVEDINKNRYRVRSILTRLSNTRDKRDITNVLKQLVREELLSPEQFEKLSKLEDVVDLPAIALIIRDTK